MSIPSHTWRQCLLGTLILLTGCRHNAFDVPDGFREFAYVANSAANTVTVLDLVYLRPDRTLAVGEHPSALAVSPTRNEVYVVNAQPGAPTGSVSVIDTLKNTVVATIPVGRDPVALSVDRSGQRAFIANAGSNSVTVVDLDTRRAIASAPTGDRPDSALISPDGHTLVVTNEAGGSISLYTTPIPPLSNGATLITKTGYGPPITLRTTIPNCPGATSPVILPNSSKTFVACAAGHQVFSIALAAAPDPAQRQDPTLFADHLLAILDVGQNPTHLTLKPDGGEVFASNLTSNSVSEISTETNDVGSTYPIGERPTFGVVSGDNSALWISNSNADSISLYSISDGKLVSSIRTGASPGALAFSSDEHLLLAADTKAGDVALIRTESKLGPALFTILPAGVSPAAIVIKSIQAKP